MHMPNNVVGCLRRHTHTHTHILIQKIVWNNLMQENGCLQEQGLDWTGDWGHKQHAYKAKKYEIVLHNKKEDHISIFLILCIYQLYII